MELFTTCSRVNVLARYTIFWQAYSTIFPTKRHKAVGKNSGLTNYIERFNNTRRSFTKLDATTSLAKSVV
jgi:IS1 family transposase